MREYELVFIVRSDLSDDTIGAVTEKVDRCIEEYKGIRLIRETWGRKKLAYEIEKHTKGIYFFYQFLGDGALVKEMERRLKLDEATLRYMTVKVRDNVDPAARLRAFQDDATEAGNDAPAGASPAHAVDTGAKK